MAQSVLEMLTQSYSGILIIGLLRTSDKLQWIMNLKNGWKCCSFQTSLTTEPLSSWNSPLSQSLAYILGNTLLENRLELSLWPKVN